MKDAHTLGLHSQEFRPTGHAEAVELLLEAGANPNFSNHVPPLLLTPQPAARLSAWVLQ